ncbi:MAG: DUF5060 domain-containing protein [Chloroflexota bacterium]
MRTILGIGLLLIMCGALAPTQVDSRAREIDHESSDETTRAQTTIGKWERFEVAYTNTTWDGNPFDLEFTGTFRHTSSGRTLTQLGFYAGNDTWKIYFMPDAVGEWTFETASSDPDLDGRQGSFQATESSLPGPLVGEGNRWRLNDTGEYVAPIMLPTREWFKSTQTADGVDDFITWADDTAGALIIGTTLVYFQHEQAASPYIKGEEGETFNIPMWDRMNSHLDMVRDRGMGHYIMFYSDDSEAPNRWGIREQSAEELRLFRYAIARFAPYPMVMWDTGIDISETRTSGWIDWFADWFNEHDPWGHPVGSRFGGGSGGHHPDSGTYISEGGKNVPDHSEVVSDWEGCSLPRAYTDRWREDYGRGNFDRDKIRRAVWEVGLVGGNATYVSGNESDGYLDENYASDLKAAPDLGHRSRFFQSQIVEFGSLSPYPDLVTAGNNVVLVANLGQEYVAYSSSGGTIGVDLSGNSNTFAVTWYNPRTGQSEQEGNINGGSEREFSAPFSGDAVLHLYSGQPRPTPLPGPYSNYLPSITHDISNPPASLDNCGDLGNRSANTTTAQIQRLMEAGDSALQGVHLNRILLVVGTVLALVVLSTLYMTRLHNQR